MVDITKEEVWNNRYQEVSKAEKKNNIIKEFIVNNKIITMLLIFFGVLTISNIILVYKFFEILTSIN